jgi:glycerol-3-phosphate dehydrogenase (NAD+)
MLFKMSDLLKRVAVVGSGNWYVKIKIIWVIILFIRGSTIAKIIGNNITKFNTFENEIRMYVYEELVNGRKLTEIINEEHENVKYLPGFKFTPNVVSFLYVQLINSNTILI